MVYTKLLLSLVTMVGNVPTLADAALAKKVPKNILTLLDKMEEKLVDEHLRDAKEMKEWKKELLAIVDPFFTKGGQDPELVDKTEPHLNMRRINKEVYNIPEKMQIEWRKEVMETAFKLSSVEL